MVKLMDLMFQYVSPIKIAAWSMSSSSEYLCVFVNLEDSSLHMFDHVCTSASFLLRGEGGGGDEFV